LTATALQFFGSRSKDADGELCDANINLASSEYQWAFRALIVVNIATIGGFIALYSSY